jgi:hypothetical protein
LSDFGGAAPAGNATNISEKNSEARALRFMGSSWI